MSLRPSPSPSPKPNGGSGGAPPNNLKPINVRASLQPQAPTPRTPSGQTPLSPRPPGINTSHGRPTSELLSGSNGMFQTPESEAIDQWFENLQNYETTLEEMAAASLDVNFKEELSAIEQWFRVLSEAERTAALYSLLQHSTQMQIRFFITVLQQMARSDPMTALLSPAIGSSMQSQMDAKLQSMGMGLKSPALPSSPSSRTFGGNINRQSIGGGETSSFLSPDSANIAPGAGGNDAAATLAHQRARLKANAAHRISAPGTLVSEGGARGSNVWPSSQLGQVVERAPSPNRETFSPSPTNAPTSARPKSTDFTGVANSFRSPRVAAVAQAESHSMEDQLSPMVGGNWASMVNTPLDSMFGGAARAPDNNPAQGNNLDAAAAKLANWTLSNNTNGRVVLDDARKFRRASATKSDAGGDNSSAVYGDDGELVAPGNQQQPQQSAMNQAPQRGVGMNQGNNNTFGGGFKGNGSNAGGNGYLAPQNWAGAGQRSPALSNVSSGRFNGSDHEALAAMNFAAANGPLSANSMALGMGGMQPFGMFNGGMPGMPMPSMSPMGLVGGMEGLALNPLQQAQIFAAQMAASGYNPAMFGLPQGAGGARSTRTAGRSPGNKTSSLNGRGGGDAGSKDKEEEVDPTVLADVPGWLRSLRLHKYTPNFEGMTWKDMVVMDEAALEGKGVAALGARRKLLKTFEAVRNKMGIEHPA